MEAKETSSPQSLEASPPPPRSKKPVTWWILLIGVLLPAVTLGVEVTTGFCAQHLFDPVPTIWHQLLVAMVPGAVLLVRFSDSGHLDLSRPLLPALLGLALTVSLIYTAPFVPLMPIAVMAIMIYGMGLLPLAPPLAAIALATIAWRLRRQPRWSHRFGWRLGSGMASGLLLLALADAPAIVTHVGLGMATSSDAESRRSGIRLLRQWGSDDDLRQACYRRPSRSVLLLFREGVSPIEVREVYYRVTGEPWNAQPPPEHFSFAGRERWNWDSDQGGEAVGQRLAGLALASSEIAGSIDADAALAYLEWTMVLSNTAASQAEARTEIALPPGGVVSRVTLWVDGEPREAAFAGRGKVRQAYESIVRTLRDPLLVTTSGRDRVLVQCFPVLPDGEMKIRLGITLPLDLVGPGRGRFHLPTLTDRNFEVGDELVHRIELDSEASWHLGPGGAGSGERSPIRLTDSDLLDFATFVEVERDPSLLEVWSKAPEAGLPPDEGPAEQFVSGSIEADIADPVRELVVVVDGSRGMEPYREQLAELLHRLDGREIAPTVLLASDIRGPAASAERPGSHQAPAGAAAAWFAEQPLVGGQDNAPALRHAWELAAASPGGAVLWITAPQPVDLRAGTLPIDDSPAGDTRLFVLPVRRGPHWLLGAFDSSPTVHLLARYGTLVKGLAEIPGLSEEPAYGMAYGRRAGEPPAAAVETSPHLARLWADDEVRRLLATGSKAQRAEALRLAVGYQLVTPVSGAVVLETQAQYEQAGLEPVAPGTVPTIPEPATILLLAVALLIALTTQRGQTVMPGRRLG